MQIRQLTAGRAATVRERETWLPLPHERGSMVIAVLPLEQLAGRGDSLIDAVFGAVAGARDDWDAQSGNSP